MPFIPYSLNPIRAIIYESYPNKQQINKQLLFQYKL